MYSAPATRTWHEFDRRLSEIRLLGDDVALSGERLQDLLRVTQHVISDLRLPEVFRRVVDVAREITRADNSVLCVFRADGSISEYVQAGPIEETESAHLVQWALDNGLLCPSAGELPSESISDFTRRPASVDQNPRGDGVPALGVSLRVRGEVFADLYVAASPGSGFFRQDEELLRALADTASVAIDNACLYEESRARQLWLQASAEITSELLRDESSRPLELIVRRTLEVAAADTVMIMLPDEDGVHLRGAVGVDGAGNPITDVGVPIEGSTHGLVMLHSRPIRITDSSQLMFRDRAEAIAGVYSQMMMLPLVDARGARGVLTVCRSPGRAPFSDADLQMATSFASHAALSLELGDARRDGARVVLLEDRDRIARDLHDHVIARLFATGLVLERIASDVGPSKVATHLLSRVGDIDDTIREIRSSIFQLRGGQNEASSAAGRGVVQSLLTIATESEESLGFAPTLRFRGTPDGTSAEIADNLAAVLREALANVVRHASASHVEVDVEVDQESVAIMVSDDGVGLAKRAHSSGLENLRQRALRRGGEFIATSQDRGGTTLIWRVPAERMNG